MMRMDVHCCSSPQPLMARQTFASLSMERYPCSSGLNSNMVYVRTCVCRSLDRQATGGWATSRMSCAPTTTCRCARVRMQISLEHCHHRSMRITPRMDGPHMQELRATFVLPIQPLLPVQPVLPVCTACTSQMLEWAEQYGGIYKFSLGCQWVVVVSDPVMASQVRVRVRL